MTPLLRLDAVMKSFGAIRALRGVSFDLFEGEVHALLGENGAGKSTLIRLISGAHQPDSGVIEIGGRKVAGLTPRMAHRLGVACVYQQPALFRELTVAENLALRLEEGRWHERVRWGQRREQAQLLLGRIGARLDPDMEVGWLSMPEQQLVEIACALGSGARVLLLDEPTACLTSREQSVLFELVRALRSEGAGIIYITHRLDEIVELADRVTVLRDGESVGTRGVPRASSAEAGGEAVGGSVRLDEAELIGMMIGRERWQRTERGAVIRGKVICSLRGVGSSRNGVRGVTLDIRAGEILGLAGLVGAGRTELAQLLFGIVPIEEGEVRIEGREVVLDGPESAIALGVGYLPEDRRRHGIIAEMTVAENSSMAVHGRLFPRGWLRPEAERELAQRFVDELGIRTAGLDARVATLSGGNQQKVALARWLAVEPKLLLLDEPTQGVDIAAKDEIHSIIRRLAQQGVAIVVISSDLAEIRALSDRVAVMRAGSVAAVFERAAKGHEIMAAALGSTA